MAITLRCQSSATNAEETCTILGVLKIAADANVESGEGDFDAGDGTDAVWTLSNLDTSGVAVSSNYERLAADDSLQVLTASGERTVTVVSVAVGAETTAITVTVDSDTGDLNVGDNTAVWACVPKT